MASASVFSRSPRQQPVHAIERALTPPVVAALFSPCTLPRLDPAVLSAYRPLFCLLSMSHLSLVCSSSVPACITGLSTITSRLCGHTRVRLPTMPRSLALHASLGTQLLKGMTMSGFSSKDRAADGSAFIIIRVAFLVMYRFVSPSTRVRIFNVETRLRFRHSNIHSMLLRQVGYHRSSGDLGVFLFSAC